MKKTLGLLGFLFCGVDGIIKRCNGPLVWALKQKPSAIVMAIFSFKHLTQAVAWCGLLNKKNPRVTRVFILRCGRDY